MCAHAERLRGKGQVVRKAPCLVQGSITEQRVGGGAETPVDRLQVQRPRLQRPRLSVWHTENSAGLGVPENCKAKR